MADRSLRSSSVRGYLVALASAAAGVLLRWLLDPWLGNFLPLVTLYGAVAVAVWYGGYGPSLLAAGVGFLACDYLFIEPRGSFALNEVHDRVGLLAYLSTCAVIIALGETMRGAWRRTQASQQDLVHKHRQLEKEAAIRRQAEEELRESEDRVAAELEEMTRLHALSTRLLSATDLHSALDDVLEGAIRTSQADFGNIQLFDPQSAALEIVAQRGFRQDFLHYFRFVRVDQGSCCAQAMESGQRIIIEDVELDPTYEPHRRIAAAAGYRGVQSTPLKSHSGNVLGILSTHFRQPHRPSERDQRLLDLYARHAADFVERLQAEEQLRTMQEQLRIVTDAMSAPVTRCSRDLRYLWVSKPYADWIGLPAQEIIGRPIHDIIGDEAYQHLRSRFEQVLAGQQVRYEEEVDFRGLGPRWINAVYSPTVDASGAPDGWVAVVLDVTEQKRAVEQLRGAEEHIRSVVNTVIDGIITIDESGTVKTFNPAAEKLFGYQAGEVVGQNVKMLMPQPYHSEHDGYLASYHRTGQARIIGIGREVAGRRKDGSTFPMDLAVSEFRLSDRCYFTGIVRDITERKRIEEALRFSEQRARAFLDNSAIIAWLKDEQGRNVFLSDNYVRRFGLENWKDKTDFELWPRDIAKQYQRNDLLVLGRDRPFECVEEARTPNGDISFWLISKFWFQDASGTKFVGGVGVDITERKRAEEALKDADRRKDEFLATLAHELRNPLAPMRNAVEILRRANGQADLSQTAQGLLERQLGLMVRLIDDLLDVSRITRGKLQLRKERVDLAAVVHSAVEAARPSIEAQAHELTVTLPPQPIHLIADPTRLAQVFLNLLTNAAKYTERGGHIWLTAEPQGGEAVVSVRDTGIGIAAEHIPRLFQMFSQVSSALDRSQGGLGIGLSLVRGLVALHGGSVEAHSGGPGMGSEFVVRLPAQDRDEGRRMKDEDKQAQSDGSPSLTPHRSSLRILIVDDNRDAADSLATMLRLSGHNIQTAHDGLEAVQAAASFRPEVVLLDIGLPKMNGYEAARHIREQPWGENMALIALTGWGQEDDKRRSWEAGFDHHLTKPVDPAALEKLLALIAPARRQ